MIFSEVIMILACFGNSKIIQPWTCKDVTINLFLMIPPTPPIPLSIYKIFAIGLLVDCLSENLASSATLEARKADACMLDFKFLPSQNIK